MQKRLFILCLILATSSTIAQVTPFTKAYGYYIDGELDKAKKEIDIAIEAENTKHDIRTWIYRGVHLLWNFHQH
ncbi:MAG: hypothetical protein MK212_22025 [Saprospiraceae bacterium]|nr:hypothetical protein [Saprospiraceae bacterium]